NDFILYGKSGEFASNKTEDHEVLMLSLHLLQVSLVYVNALMIQQVLAQPDWHGRLTPPDRRALTPLKWQHQPVWHIHVGHAAALTPGTCCVRPCPRTATLPKFRPSLR